MESSILFSFDAADSAWTSSAAQPALEKESQSDRALREPPESCTNSQVLLDGNDDLKAIQSSVPRSASTMPSQIGIRRGRIPTDDAQAARTPPIAITTNLSNAPHEQPNGSKQATVPLSLQAFSRQASRSDKPVKKKKRHHKKSPIPALNTVRGFTPVTSADEDSDFAPRVGRGRASLQAKRSNSVLRKDVLIDDLKPDGNPADSRASSPSGMSALTHQLEQMRTRSTSARPHLPRNPSKLASSETPSSASVTSDTEADDDATQMTSYEVNLEHDFVSSEVSTKDRRDARQDPLFNGGIFRKMHATDFEPLRCLGKGSYGTVLLVKQYATGKLFAQKQFRKASLTVRKSLIEQTKTERNILESINRHPFVVKLYYAFQDHEKLYLILEYAQGGELFERMRNERMFPETTAAFYMAELVLALDHLHNTVGVVYRDLKPENCLLDSEGHLLLTDFGLSKVAVDGDYRCRSMAGTTEYMAPEVLREQEYDTAVDWWSLGVLGFELLTGSSPFQANNDTKTREKILKAKLVLPYFMSVDAKDLLTRLLRKESKKRLGANMPKDLQTIKSHRFFKPINWARLSRRELEPPIHPLVTNPELAENFSAEFTDLAVSPVRMSILDSDMKGIEQDPFGGFSFVGSRSLLESGHGCS